MPENKSATSCDTCFITWHLQSRSRNIASRLNIPIYELEVRGNAFKRHFLSSLWTLGLIAKKRPASLIIQYSFLLLVIMAFYKLFRPKRVTIIADCHTKALRRRASKYLDILFWPLKRWSFKYADTIIISNIALTQEAAQLNSQVIALPDPIPDFSRIHNDKNGEKYCVFISSFASDEPIREMAEAAALLEPDLPLLWTGRVPNSLLNMMEFSDNIRFTSYLEDDDYQRLLKNAQCLIILTNEEGCLMSGAYEGLAAGVPMVLSDTEALRGFFGRSALYCNHTPENIAATVKQAIIDGEALRQNSLKIRDEREREFASHLAKLKHALIANKAPF